MSPDCKDVIDTGDGVVVDMSYFNVPPVREAYIAKCDMPMVETISKQLGLTLDEAFTKSLYQACRMVVRRDGREGHFGWIADLAEEYWRDRP